MSLKALIMGYGSIGKRHAEILCKMGVFGSISVLSNQKDLPYETIKSLSDISGLGPDYVVIASPTVLHYKQLKFLEDNFQSIKILVEKPLFECLSDLSITCNEVYVGYNLRFHPIIQKLKNTIIGRKIWNINVFCGSYLPAWRSGRNYRITSSARRDLGGGVLLDLSHELDYVQWLAGHIEVKHVVRKKVSDLEINTDDLLLLSGMTENETHVHITLNYFTRKPLRQILVDGEGISIQGDLVSNTLVIIEDGKESNFKWPELERNATYRDQHQAIISGDSKVVCTFNEGIEIMDLIDRIRSFENL